MDLRHFASAPSAPALLDRLAQRCPDAEAVIDGARRWTFARLRAEAVEVATGLWRLGVRPGDRVAILMGNRAEWLSSWFGILGLRASAVALNTWLTPREQAYQLRHARVTTLILADRFRERDLVGELAAMRAGGLADLRNVIVLGDALPDDAVAFDSLGDPSFQHEIEAAWTAVQPDDIACILYTSGSTAMPKGVPLRHGGLIANAWQIGERMHLGPDERLWCAVSLFWSFGCVNALFTLYSHGGCAVLQHHFEPGEALRLIEAERCTVFYGTPNMALALTEHPDRPSRDLSSLRTGAAIGTPEQMQRIADLGAREICNVYGLTEAYGNSAVADAKAPLSRRLIASGPPLPGVALRILDLDSGAPAAPGTVGEIALKGRLMPGYLEDQAATAAAFSADGFLLTGDLGLIDQDGWLHFRGRLKELIKSGGINIAPAEIEAVLTDHPAVDSAYVIGLPDPRLDQAVAAVVVPAGTAADAETLRAHCRAALAAYKVPRRFVFVAAGALPLTSTGKLQRNRLADLFADQ